MSDRLVLCPRCDRPLKVGARFCAGCGLEVRQPCPACSDMEHLWLAPLGLESSPWCANRGLLRFACEACGRWLLPGTSICPDPNCEARVLPPWPQHTGRRWDGRGSAVGWTWPRAWDRYAPDARRPLVGRWNSPDTIHAAFVAVGKLYVWAGTSLIVALESGVESLSAASDSAGRVSQPRRPQARTGVESRVDCERPSHSYSPLPSEERAIEGEGVRVLTPSPLRPFTPSRVDWRSPLPAFARPAPETPFEERVATAGAACVLATERGYLLVGLRNPGDSRRLDIGSPLAQVGGPFWWIAWSLQEGRPRLHRAAVGYIWDALAPQPVETPPEAEMAAGGRLVLRDGRAYWPGKDGGVWMLECGSGVVQPCVEPLEGLRMVWAEADGPRIAREYRGQIAVSLAAPRSGPNGAAQGMASAASRTLLAHPAEAVAEGAGLRSVLVAAPYTFVVGDRIAVFDTRSGDPQPDIKRPLGRWVSGAAVQGPEGEPRLLALTGSDAGATLYALRRTGAEESLWSEPNVEPLGLLPVGESLLIAHSRGITQLSDERTESN